MACFLAALLYFIWAFFHSEQLCFTGRLSQGDTDPVVVCIFLVTCLTKVGMGKLAFCNSSYHFRATAEERHAACKAESAALHRSCTVARTTKRGTARHATMVPTRLKRSCSWYSRSQLLGPTYPWVPSTSNMMLRTPTVSVGYTVGVAVCKRSLSVTLRLGEQITSHIHRHSNRL